MEYALYPTNRSVLRTALFVRLIVIASSSTTVGESCVCFLRCWCWEVSHGFHGFYFFALLVRGQPADKTKNKIRVIREIRVSPVTSKTLREIRVSPVTSKTLREIRVSPVTSKTLRGIRVSLVATESFFV